MKVFKFSSIRLMTSLCLFMFVSLAATTLQAQRAKHNIVYALHEVDDPGEPYFALWNISSKRYMDCGVWGIHLHEDSNFEQKMERLSNGAYQYEDNTLPGASLACCEGSENYAYKTDWGTSKDDLIFEEVSKDVFLIKFKDNNAYLTVNGPDAMGKYHAYGNITRLGDEQLWMITGQSGGKPHNIVYAIHEVDDRGEPKFALYHPFNKTYLYWIRESGVNKLIVVPASLGAKYVLEIENLWFSDKRQVEHDTPIDTDPSLACCEDIGNSARVYLTEAATAKDDVKFIEVRKDVYKILFTDTGRYLTHEGTPGNYRTYGFVGDRQHLQEWQIVGYR